MRQNNCFIAKFILYIKRIENHYTNNLNALLDKRLCVFFILLDKLIKLKY